MMRRYERLPKYANRAEKEAGIKEAKLRETFVKACAVPRVLFNAIEKAFFGTVASTCVAPFLAVFNGAATAGSLARGNVEQAKDDAKWAGGATLVVALNAVSAFLAHSTFGASPDVAIAAAFLPGAIAGAGYGLLDGISNVREDIRRAEFDQKEWQNIKEKYFTLG